MDLYDPQTLGIMVFGGFMVISALGIVLVSTFSMKETSYEEALAKQRREQGKTVPLGQLTKKDKKKEKASEKKNRGKKEHKPNGKLPELDLEDITVAEPELAPEPVSAPKPAPKPTPAPEPTPAPKPAPEPTFTPAPEPTPALAPPAVEASPAPKKKKEKKMMAKVEPALAAPAPAPMAPSKPAPAAAAPMAPSKPAPAAAAPMAPSKPAPVLEAVTKEVPVMAVPPVGSQRTAAKAQETKAHDLSKKKASSKKKTESVLDSGLDSPLFLPYKALVSTVSSMVFSQGEAQRLLEILSDKAGIRQDTWHVATQKGDPVAVMKKQLEENQKQLATQQEDASAAKNRLRELSRELSAEKSKVASVETRLSSQLSSREQEMIALQARMQASYQDHVAQTQKLNAKVLSLQEQLESGPTAQLARLQQENSILRDALNQATSQAESKQNAELAKLRQDCAKLTKELGEKSVSLQTDEVIRTGLEAKVSSVEKQLSSLQASHAESEQELQRRLEEVSEELRSSQRTLEKAQQDASTLSDLQVHLGSVEDDLKKRGTQLEALTAQLEQTELEKGQLEDQVGSINVLLEASQNRDENEDLEMWSWSFLNNTNHFSSSLQDRDVQLASLQEKLKQLKEMKQEAAMTPEVTTAETEQAPNSEDRCLVVSLQEELKQLKEEMEQLLNSPVAPQSFALKSADVSGESDQLLNGLEKSESQEVTLEEEEIQLKEESEQAQSSTTSHNAAELAALQTSLAEREAMMKSLREELREARDQSQKVQEILAQVQQSQESQPSTELPELLEKLKEAEDSHGTLQAQCDQYRTVLAETEGMLTNLQKSVEGEELVWMSKMADSEDQLKKALEQVRTLEETAESLKTGNQSIEQLKEQVMLLESQLEKPSETEEEMAQLKKLLSESQSQLESSQTQAQTHREELATVRGQLSEATEHAQSQKAVPEAGAQNGPTEPEVQSQLSQTTEEFEQAQKTVELQAQKTVELQAQKTVELQAQKTVELQAQKTVELQAQKTVELQAQKTVELQAQKTVELQAQKTVELQAQKTVELQAQLDILKEAGDSPQADTEDVAQLKEESSGLKEGTSV
ncbi:ribosome-binding protein 1 isoform X2 [Oncorhynchus kisutch]|uniref:ribosome-binding protein 1 isoform X2 n=1 Tax=Oncorhynchus kisutch TaxID=8019 RepID=UPI0012DE98C4|nr:ribosome-binding protein 1 isoform X2 [Oncorhynchus kisutch]